MLEEGMRLDIMPAVSLLHKEVNECWSDHAPALAKVRGQLASNSEGLTAFYIRQEAGSMSYVLLCPNKNTIPRTCL